MKPNVDLTEHGLFITSNSSFISRLAMAHVKGKPWEFKNSLLPSGKFSISQTSVRKPWDFSSNTSIVSSLGSANLLSIIRKPWEFDKDFIMFDLCDGALKTVYAFTPQSKLIMTGNEAERKYKMEDFVGNNNSYRIGNFIKPWDF